MKLIPLSQGKFAMVDDADFDWLNQWKWHVKKGYSTHYAAKNDYSSEKQKIIKMHRLILGLIDPKIEGDHKDGNGLNNQRSNLREATHTQNMRNRKSHGSSKYLGVYYSNTKRLKNRWMAQISVRNKIKYLGCFNTEIEAALAYNQAAKIYHGEFANLNII